jgi:C4-dicarboxylate-specific signal transduction histidine kinase
VRVGYTVKQVLDSDRAGIDPTNCINFSILVFTTKPNGMGMGLPISRSIIEAHGGRLWTVRNDAAGSTFKFSVPAAV